MSLVDEMAFGLKLLIRSQGGPVIVRKTTTMPGPNPAPNPPTFDGLVVDGAQTAGSLSLNLRGDPFVGRFIPGDQFTIAGDPNTYTVTAEAISSTTTDSVSVSISPALAENAADGAAVTVTSYAADTSAQAVITDLTRRQRDNQAVEFSEHRIRFLASDLPDGFSPSTGDIVMFNGETARVTETSHMEIKGVHYGWALRVRS